jgi:antitoxin component YwqK of YwqJK toxin-antitoxin module
MAKTRAKRTPHTGRHKDGSLWAKGYMKGDVMDGPWKWFRKDGTVMRSGAFDNGVQVGEWVTYDGKGSIVKVTRMTGKEKQKK